MSYYSEKSPQAHIEALGEFYGFLGANRSITTAEMKATVGYLLETTLSLPKPHITLQTLVADNAELDIPADPESLGARYAFAGQVCRLLVVTGSSDLKVTARKHALQQTYRFLKGDYEDAMPEQTHAFAVAIIANALKADRKLLRSLYRMGGAFAAAHDAIAWSQVFKRWRPGKALQGEIQN